MLSLAGTYLRCPTPELAAWIGANVRQSDAFPFLNRAFPGARLAGLAWPTGFRPAEPVRVGTLSWPAGAARFAVGHFLASANDAAAVRAAAFGADGTRMDPITLRIESPGSDAAEAVRTSVYLMPPTPLSGYRTHDPDWPGLYLLTVVDERLFWAQESFSCSVTPTTSWDDLFAIAEGVLGRPIVRNPIPVAYVRPHASLSMNAECLAIALDAIAANCGLHIVRKLSGDVHAMDYPTATTTFDANLAVKARTVGAGGSRFLDRL